MNEWLELVERQVADAYADLKGNGYSELQRRVGIAARTGHFDARAAVYLYQTYGLHFADMLPKLAKVGLKMDWSGLDVELQLIGMSKRAAESLIAEAKFFAMEIGA